MSRQQRRAAARMMEKLGTLEQHFDRVLRDVRAEFERTGNVHAGFVCVSDTEIFHIPGTWAPDERGAAYAGLRDSFRHRGVNRYVFVSEGWTSKKTDMRPTDDPDHGEIIQVTAVERGARKVATAEITRNGGTAKLGPWENDEQPQGWLIELLEEGHSDRPVKAEPAPLAEFSLQDPTKRSQAQSAIEVLTQLENLIEAEKMTSEPAAMFMAMDCVVRGIFKDIMGSPKGLGQFARFLRDHPDKFPMFSAIEEDEKPSKEQHLEHAKSCKESLQRFVGEQREAGHEAIFSAFWNSYLRVGSYAIGALRLAEHIEEWIPEGQAKLREVGLRSAFELDDEEGRIFLALSAAHYPVGIMGRSNADDELFVSSVTTFPAPDFATAVDFIKQHVDLILGSEARDLFRKMEKLGRVPAGDPMRNDEQIWQLENWAENEWTEQSAAEFMFAEVMNVQCNDDANQLDGNVAGYCVRRAPDGLVLVPADSDEDFYVAVKVANDGGRISGIIRGWLRGSEGKVPQYYQNGRWVIPAEALHKIKDLPGKERLRGMPPFEEMPAEQ